MIIAIGATILMYGMLSVINGLNITVIRYTKNHIKIPMEGQAESLNAAICAAVYMYEIYRQRRN